MKNIASAALCAAIIFAPLAALADATPPALPPEPPNFGVMEQVHGQVDKARATARTTMLNALSASHRSLLSQVVGNLAVAQTPDVSAAAKTLDGALTPGESKAILDASSAFELQVRQIMEAARKTSGEPVEGGMRIRIASADQGPPDAGMILLRTALPPMGMNMMFRAGGGPPPPGM
jgi:hypothetical protein